MIKIEFDNLTEMYALSDIGDVIQDDIGGIYFFYDVNQELIYVGRSKELKKRLLAHVKGETHTAEYCHDFTHFRIMYVTSRTALKIYELYAIQQFKPKYNVMDNYEDYHEDEKYIKSVEDIKRDNFNNFVLGLIKVNKSLPLSIEMVKMLCENNGHDSDMLMNTQTLNFLERNRVEFKNRKFCYE